MKDAATLGEMIELGTRRLPAEPKVQFGSEQHPDRRRRQIDPDARQTPLGRADATLRAGLRLMPESGASKAM